MYVLMRQDRSLPEHEHVKAPGGGAFGTGRGNVGSCAAEAGLLPQPGSTERHMRCLQQQPLLRVQKGGLGGGDAKKGCIECVDACMVASAGLIRCGGFLYLHWVRCFTSADPELQPPRRTRRREQR